MLVRLLSEVFRNISGILPTARSEFIAAHFASSGKTLTVESATTMGKCWLDRLEFSWLKSKPHNEFEAQCTLCKRTLNLGSHKIGKTPVSFQKSRHTSVHLCHQFPVQVYPVLLDLISGPPPLSRRQATFKPSSAQLRRWHFVNKSAYTCRNPACVLLFGGDLLWLRWLLPEQGGSQVIGRRMVCMSQTNTLRTQPTDKIEQF